MVINRRHSHDGKQNTLGAEEFADHFPHIRLVAGYGVQVIDIQLIRHHTAVGQGTVTDFSAALHDLCHHEAPFPLA